MSKKTLQGTLQIQPFYGTDTGSGIRDGVVIRLTDSISGTVVVQGAVTTEQFAMAMLRHTDVNISYEHFGKYVGAKREQTSRTIWVPKEHIYSTDDAMLLDLLRREETDGWMGRIQDFWHRDSFISNATRDGVKGRLVRVGFVRYVDEAGKPVT